MQEDDVRAVLSDDYTSVAEQETTDIYLLPPNEDPETCTSWLRMRNRNGRYTLMFEETVCDGDVMISPRIKFEVGVRILGGLMALGYEVGAIMKRRSRSYSDEMLEVKIDWIEGLDRSFTQIQGKVRAAVEEAGNQAGPRRDLRAPQLHRAGAARGDDRGTAQPDRGDEGQIRDGGEQELDGHPAPRAIKLGIRPGFHSQQAGARREARERDATAGRRAQAPVGTR